MFTRVASLVLISASGAFAADPPPKVSLPIPEAFNFRVASAQYQKGQAIVAEPEWARMTALASFTERSGCFGDCSKKDMDRFHVWTIRVYRGASQKVITACAGAKDGYDARLNEGAEFLGSGGELYMYARFERKQLRWGKAVSFFSQSTQDAALYVPHNGHLQYEIWGVTLDQRYTVVATVSVSHPRLAGWWSQTREVRNARTLSALKKDKDYKLVEKCRADEFEPSLKVFDRFVDNLSFEEASNQAPVTS